MSSKIPPRQTSSANRRDKQQPIIIQNFELQSPSQSGPRRKSHLSAANLYLSHVSLSRNTPPTTPLHPIRARETNGGRTFLDQSKLKDDGDIGASTLIKEGQFWKPSVEVKPLSKKKVTFSEECNGIKPLKTKLKPTYLANGGNTVHENTDNVESDNILENEYGNPDSETAIVISNLDNPNDDALNVVTARNSICSSGYFPHAPANSEAVDGVSSTCPNPTPSSFAEIGEESNFDPEAQLNHQEDGNEVTSTLSSVLNVEKLKSTGYVKKVSFNLGAEKKDSLYGLGDKDSYYIENVKSNPNVWYEKEKSELLNSHVILPPSAIKTTDSDTSRKPLGRDVTISTKENEKHDRKIAFQPTKIVLSDERGNARNNKTASSLQETNVKLGSRVVKLSFLRDEVTPLKLDSKRDKKKAGFEESERFSHQENADEELLQFEFSNSKETALRPSNTNRHVDYDPSTQNDVSDGNDNDLVPGSGILARPRSQSEINSDFLMKMYSSSGERKLEDGNDEEEISKRLSQSSYVWHSRKSKLSKENTSPDLLHSSNNSVPKRRHGSLSQCRTVSFENLSRVEEKERELLTSARGSRPTSRGGRAEVTGRQRSASARKSRDEIWRDQRQRFNMADRYIIKGDSSKVAERTPMNKRLEQFVVFSTPCPRLRLVLERAKSHLI